MRVHGASPFRIQPQKSTSDSLPGNSEDNLSIVKLCPAKCHGALIGMNLERKQHNLTEIHPTKKRVSSKRIRVIAVHNRICIINTSRAMSHSFAMQGRTFDISL